MSKNQQSMDGFIPRRSGTRLGEFNQPERSGASLASPLRRKPNAPHPAPPSTPRVGVPRPGLDLGRSNGPSIGKATATANIGRYTNPGSGIGDLDESLRNIDAEPSQNGGKKSRRQHRKDKKEGKKPQSKARRIIKRVLILLLIIFIGVGGFLVVRGLGAGNDVLQGNIFNLVQSEPLKEDANGRSNFLIVGTSEDDEGHEGADLTDSIMILSVNQSTKNAYTFSIPRDLYVDYGQACLSGYRGKINAYFSCTNDGTDEAAEQDRLAKTSDFIGNIVGMDIQYAAQVNYTVMRDVINAVGGSIEVNIEGNEGTGPQPDIGIMDANFDWKCGPISKRKINCPPDGHFIDFEPGIQTIDAERALYLAQARGVGINIGLAQSNFDRERNQQKILVAIRDKALSAGTLTNLGKVTGLIDALGGNLRTNVQTSEVRTLMEPGQEIESSNIQSIDLFTQDTPMFTTGTIPGAGSSVYPTAGVGRYTELRQYLAKQLTSNPVVKEAAAITVLNGSGVSGVGQSVADSLTEKNLTVDEVGNAPEGEYAAYEVYKIGEGNPATTTMLEELYKVKVKTTVPPVSITGETDFVIIVGRDPAATQ